LQHTTTTILTANYNDGGAFVTQEASKPQ